MAARFQRSFHRDLPSSSSSEIVNRPSLFPAAMIGHLGTQQLGAVSLANLAISFATFTFGFLAFLTSPRIGAAYVAGNKQQVSRVAAVGLWLAGGLGLLTTLGMSFMAGPIVGGKYRKGSVYHQPVAAVQLSP